MESKRTKSLVQEMSFRFAVDAVKYAGRDHKDPIIRMLVRQLVRSGTSIGANVEEALGGQSRKDFIAKLSIAAKEARETGYWLRLIQEAQPHGSHELAGLLSDCTGLTRMLNSIILTTRGRSASKAHSNTQASEYPGNPELRTQNSKLRTQNSELSDKSEISDNSELITHNSELFAP
jgi:four helix bundle protein